MSALQQGRRDRSSNELLGFIFLKAAQVKNKKIPHRAVQDLAVDEMQLFLWRQATLGPHLIHHVEADGEVRVLLLDLGNHCLEASLGAIA